jgi:peptidoglycan/LPS O-acetylase OafA/YrhL
MPGPSPWLLILAALVAGALLAAFAGVRPRVTFRAVIGLCIALVPIIAFLFTVWAVDGLDFGRHVFPFLPFLAVAALVLPATMPSRTERPEGSRLGEISTKWTRTQPTSEDSQ